MLSISNWILLSDGLSQMQCDKHSYKFKLSKLGFFIPPLEQYIYCKLGTIMTVIDNSMVIEPTGNEITVNMGYEIDILYQEEFEALFILFMSVVCALLIILSVLAVFITLRVKKVENEISECKSKVKAEWSRITDSKLTIFFLNSPQSISIICISK